MRKLLLIGLMFIALLISGCASQGGAANENPIVAQTSPTEGVVFTTNTVVFAADATATASVTSTIKPTEEAIGNEAVVEEPAETATPEILSEESAERGEASQEEAPTEAPSATPKPEGSPEPTKTPTITETASPTLEPGVPTYTTTPNSEGDIVHLVGSGETLYTIAIQYGVLTSQLIAYNTMGSSIVEPEQEIRIPVGMMSQTYTGSGGRDTPTPLPVSVDENSAILGPVSFDWQKINNCGPTTTHIMLSYYGIEQPQLTIADVLKPNPDDKNVSPHEVATYVETQGLGSFIGINGDIALLERLLAAGYPVMVEQWMQYDGGVGHYRAVRGYDRQKEQILQEDTFLGPSIWRSYSDFNRDWAYFNNTYLVFYAPSDTATVASLIGSDWTASTMWENALKSFSEQSGVLPLYGKAEALHHLGEDVEAVTVYEEAITTGLPARFFWYRFGYLEALNNIGRYQTTLNFTKPLLEAMELSEDLRYHRAVAYKELDQIGNARRELNLALQDNPNFAPARVMLAQLPAAPPPPTNAPATKAPPTSTQAAIAPAATWTRTPVAPAATWTRAPIQAPTWTPAPAVQPPTAAPPTAAPPTAAPPTAVPPTAAPPTAAPPTAAPPTAAPPTAPPPPPPTAPPPPPPTAAPPTAAPPTAAPPPTEAPAPPPPTEPPPAAEPTVPSFEPVATPSG